MGKISKDDLSKYVQDFVNKIKDSAIEESSLWLSQDDVDKLRSKYEKSD